MHSPADMADHLLQGMMRLVADRRAIDPPGSIDGLSDRDMLTHAASALGRAAPWSGLDLPYPGFEAPSGSSRARPPRCSVVLASSEVLMEARTPDLFTTMVSGPEEACWVELVLAREWRECQRCPRYATAFSERALRLVAQLATDDRIVHARLAWIVLASTEDRARQDLAQWERLALAEGLPVGAPVVRAMPLDDVQGNAACITAIVPVQRL